MPLVSSEFDRSNEKQIVSIVYSRNEEELGNKKCNFSREAHGFIFCGCLKKTAVFLGTDCFLADITPHYHQDS